MTDEHAEPGADPLAALSGRRLRRVARRASRRRRRRAADLTELAHATGLGVRHLRLLADAWDEGGAAGVDALGPAPDEPVPQADEAVEAVEAWRGRHFLLETLRCEVWRNRVTVWRLLPPPDRTGTPEPVPLLQLRVTPGGRWHLYHRAAQGEWWPVRVRGRGQPQSIADCLDAARIDAGSRFWRLRDDRTDGR